MLNQVRRTNPVPLRVLLCLLSALLLAPLPLLHAQAASTIIPSSTVRDWHSVEALPLQTKVHITTDHGGKTCRIFSITDDSLTCSKGKADGDRIQRSEIKRIKMAHYGRSALVGAGVGLGIEAASGAIGGREKPCPTGQNLCLNGIGIGPGGVAAVFGVAGALLGGVVGAVTDFTRGHSIYTRP